MPLSTGAEEGSCEESSGYSTVMESSVRAKAPGGGAEVLDFWDWERVVVRWKALWLARGRAVGRRLVRVLARSARGRKARAAIVKVATRSVYWDLAVDVFR